MLFHCPNLHLGLVGSAEMLAPNGTWLVRAAKCGVVKLSDWQGDILQGKWPKGNVRRKALSPFKSGA